MKHNMTRNQTRIVIALTSLLIVLVLGKEQVSNILFPNDQVLDNVCRLNNGQCVVNVFGEKTTISFHKRDFPLETAIPITVESSGLIEGVYAEVVGLNMFMGTIKVPFSKNDDSEFETEMFLGSCSEPSMNWLMTFYFNKGGESKEVGLIFSTQQN